MIRHHRALAVFAVGASFLFISCGSQGSDRSDEPGEERATSLPADATSASSSTTNPSRTPATTTETTTTTHPQEADAETVALAQAGRYQLGDLGAGWVAAQPAGEAKLPRVDECTNPADGEQAKLPIGNFSRSEVFQAGENPFYVRTFSAVFPDEAAAKAWVAFTDTDEFGACEKQEMEAIHAKSVPDIQIVVTPGRGAPLRGQERIRYFDIKSGDALSFRSTITTFRVGRVLTWVQADIDGAAVSASVPDWAPTAVVDELKAQRLMIERVAGLQGVPVPT